jgi:hypothetical protein
MFLGLGVVAIWVYVRYPSLQPATLTRSVAHVAVAFGSFSLLPYALRLCREVLPAPLWAGTFVVALLMPTLLYVLLSWLWLMARLHDLGKPGGGHRIRLPRRAHASQSA